MKPSTNYNTITAIILASGKGLRFGKPKAEAELHGITFQDAITSTLLKAGLSQIHVAKGYPSSDMLETLKMAINELSAAGKITDVTGFLCFPVDFPLVLPETIKDLATAHLEHPRAIIRPSYYGWSGHPIIIPATLDLDADDKGKGLKGVILHSGLSLIDIQVDDEGIHRNINRPEDLYKWTAKN